MNVKRIITAAAIAMLPLTLSAATLVVPAAGTGAGFNGSRWQTELTLHSSSSGSMNVDIAFHNADGRVAQKTIALAPRTTVAVKDIVKNQFGLETATGALVINVADADASRLAVTSRTLNVSATGTFGQDIPAVEAAEAAASGDLTVLAGPSSAIDERFNFGVYALDAATISWQLVRADGAIAARAETTHKAGSQIQYSNGVGTLFNSQAANNDVVYATVVSGHALFYGSSVNQASGDPTFVPSLRARQDIRVNFAGIDRNGDGTVDFADNNRDGVVDVPMDIVTSMFPAYFRVVVNGEAAALTLLESPADWALVGTNEIQIAPMGDLRGKTGNLKVRVTTATESAIITIPVRFI